MSGWPSEEKWKQHAELKAELESIIRKHKAQDEGREAACQVDLEKSRQRMKPTEEARETEDQEAGEDAGAP